MAERREQPDQDLLRAPEFWEEEELSARREMWRQLVRWLAVFVAVFAFGCFVIWWAGQTVLYSSARAMDAETKASWRVYGIVRDETTHEPIPFARVEDGPKAKAPHFASTADHLGHFELHTLPERHEITASALGYKPKSLTAGREWYSWMPSGDERLDFMLRREGGR